MSTAEAIKQGVGRIVDLFSVMLISFSLHEIVSVVLSYPHLDVRMYPEGVEDDDELPVLNPKQWGPMF